MSRICFDLLLMKEVFDAFRKVTFVLLFDETGVFDFELLELLRTALLLLSFTGLSFMMLLDRFEVGKI